MELLITSLEDADDLSRICSIIRLNDTTFFKRTYHSGLDHIRYIPPEVNEPDRLLNNTVESMILNQWYQKLGLSLNDVMQLEYNAFIVMDERLKKYQQAISNNASNAASFIENKLGEGL